MHRHLMGWALAVAVLGVASSASAAMIADFGSGAGKLSTLGGGYGAVQTYTFNADSVIWHGTYTAAWLSAGMQVNSLTSPLTSVSPTDLLTFDMRWTANSMFNPPTFYQIGIHLYSTSGNQSNYLAEFQGSPTANPTPFPGASSPTMTTVWTTAMAGSPASTAGNGPFNFATDTPSHMDVFIQVGPGDYTGSPVTEMELGNIQFQAVPEPASLGLLGLGAMALLRRRR